MTKADKLPRINQLSVSPIRGVPSLSYDRLDWDGCLADHDLYEPIWRSGPKSGIPLQDDDISILDHCEVDLPECFLYGPAMAYISRNITLRDTMYRQQGIIIGLFGGYDDLNGTDPRIRIYPNIVLKNVSLDVFKRAKAFTIDGTRLVPAISHAFAINARPMAGQLFKPVEPEPFAVTMNSHIQMHFC